MCSARVLRPALLAGAVACLSLWASPAHAQFANHSIGFEFGGVYIPSQGIQSGGGLGLDSTLYIESGFELYFRLLVSFHHADGLYNCATDDQPGRSGCNVVGLMPAFGFRYMFLEDSIRPYVGFNVAYEAYFTSNYTSRFSFSPMAGIEFFVSENFSLGPQLEYHLLVMLNTPGDGSDNPEHGLVGVFKIAWYF